jgi:anti-sigma-K factor RskA
MNNLCGLIDALMPWYLNGTASDSNRAQVETHIAQCAACRRRLAKERTLLEKFHDAGAAQAPATDAAWRRFETTLGSPPANVDVPARWSSWVTRGVIIAQAAAVAALAIAVVSLLGERRRGEPQFHTVTTVSAPASGQLLRIAAAADISKEQMAQVALELGGTVLAGPSSQGVFTIQLDQVRMRDRAIQKLRATPGMLLVEPLEAR